MPRFDPAFTQKLRNWLDNEHRDYSEGAMLIFKLRANQTEFRKISSDPEHYKKYIFDQIKKFHDFRSAEISHQHVVKRVDKAVSIAKTVAATVSDKTTPVIRTGKRSDHELLPDDIKKCYVDNADIMHRISDMHAKIRLIVQSNASCKDADLLPFADEIIRLDKKRLANWKKYDNYVIPS